MSNWLLSCKGCGCAYMRGPKTNGDFCQFCCEQILQDPANFKTLVQRQEEATLKRAAEVMKRLEERGRRKQS